MPPLPPCAPRSTWSRRAFMGLGGGVAAAAALSACGTGAGQPATGPAPTQTSPAVDAVLEQWYHQYGEEGTQEAVERYAAAYPHATVNVSWKPGDYDQSVVTALPTEGAPDVFEYANGPTIDMIRAGDVADVTDLYGDALADFNPALVERFTYDDRLWAVPQVVDVQLLVYRPSMLTAAGVAPPTTMDDLLDAAERLTTDDVKGLFLGNDGGVAIMGPPMLRSAGFDLLTEDGRFGFDDPAAAEALAVLRDLYAGDSLLLGAPNDWFAADALANGLTAMQFTGAWTMPALRDALGDDVGVLPWPAMTGGRANVTVGAYGACVGARGDNTDLARDFVRWLWVDGTDMQIDFATAYGLHLPSRQSVAEQAPALQDGVPADVVDLAERHGWTQYPLLWTQRSATAFTDMMTGVVRDGDAPGARIAQLKQVVDDELVRVGGTA